ncbi:Fbox domain containing protein [Acanthamoeba castellanii str. Neff]|uniref:Fbox domain containing protein n=1 Tax=Acanthamoeba castellanii (strain ATCC 30010 / Neff) TaxID=1257118 RepID=L8H9T0_ACACF|nr:Fbox domain containing protein [Acanthamoeba castellanii str. Neff]ELR21945.1 Fbox domain containing protein [Acanthamoeba castellanii str. Neff]
MSEAVEMSHEEGGDACLLLEALSNELLLHVLGFLELAPELNRVSMACRTLNELAHAPTLWRCVRFPRLAPLITPPQHRIGSSKAVGGAGDEDEASVLHKDQQSQQQKQEVQVFPDLLLQHVVARHSKDVREIDLSLVPFTQSTCRMNEDQVGELLREVFVRCTRLER